MISRDHDFVFSVVDSNTCDKIRTIRPPITCNNARNIDLRYLQFSSVQFYLAKINYNTRIHVRIVSWQGSPEETRGL